MSVLHLQFVDLVNALELLFILFGADKHDLGEVTVLFISKARDLLAGAY